ncbi:hypothetical protein [Cohaesibacter celericrescens]|nr:hypothetical protein [Cohaesibacter celericrescens]
MYEATEKWNSGAEICVAGTALLRFPTIIRMAMRATRQAGLI